MRKVEPEHGATRIVSRFLWLPLTMDHETRWLEWALIRQEYVRANGPEQISRWHDEAWAVKEE